MNKKCVYTCITGDYDYIKEIKFKEKEFDYICFTNNHNLKSKSWNVIYIDSDGLDNLTLARKNKIVGNDYLKDYELTIWIDGAMEMLKPISTFLDECCDLIKYDMIGFKHRERNCIYEELSACLKYKKETYENICKVERFLLKERYPKNNGLIESTVLVRKNKDDVNRLMELWLKILLNFSRRDQLSFNYALWKIPIKINFLDLNVFDNEYFIHQGHTTDQKNHIFKLPEKICIFNFTDEANFDYKKMIYVKYYTAEDLLSFDIKIPVSSSKFIIKFPYELGSIISNLEIENSTKIEINNIDKIGDEVFFTGEPIINVEGNFKKGKILKVQMKMVFNNINSLLNELKLRSNEIEDIVTLYEEIKKKNIELIEENKKINSKLEKIINSKGWIFLEKVRKLKFTFFKR